MLTSNGVKNMPCKANTDLPEQIKYILPEHAKDIYNEYDDQTKRRNLETLEQVAYKVAWSAVKKNLLKFITSGN